MRPFKSGGQFGEIPAYAPSRPRKIHRGPAAVVSLSVKRVCGNTVQPPHVDLRSLKQREFQQDRTIQDITQAKARLDVLTRSQY